MRPDDPLIENIVAALARAWFVALGVALAMAAGAVLTCDPSAGWGGQGRDKAPPRLDTCWTVV